MTWRLSGCYSSWLIIACVGTNSGVGDAVTVVTYSMLLTQATWALTHSSSPNCLQIEWAVTDFRSCYSSAWVSVHGSLPLMSSSSINLLPLHETSRSIAIHLHLHYEVMTSAAKPAEEKISRTCMLWSAKLGMITCNKKREHPKLPRYQSDMDHNIAARS